MIVYSGFHVEYEFERIEIPCAMCSTLDSARILIGTKFYCNCDITDDCKKSKSTCNFYTDLEILSTF